MPIPLVKGFEQSKAMTNGNVQTFLRRLPLEHVSRKHLSEIVYIDKLRLADPFDRRSNPELILSETDVNKAAGAARVWVCKHHKKGNKDLGLFHDSIYHEVGHVVFHRLLAEDRRQKWYRVHAEAEYVWTPAGSNPNEHFAETYAKFVLRPVVTAAQFPDEYAFMAEEVFPSDWKRGE